MRVKYHSRGDKIDRKNNMMKRIGASTGLVYAIEAFSFLIYSFNFLGVEVAGKRGVEIGKKVEGGRERKGGRERG